MHASGAPSLSVVLDTDTYNEVDDQFALAHLLLSPSQVDFEAVYAAPFFNSRATSPADGMEKSYDEILRVIKLISPALPPPVFRGSRNYLPAASTPVESDAARDLVARAMAPRKDKLHVLAIGACTNVASALLIEPRIAGRISVVWLGGHAPYWDTTDEFNLKQDVHAARVLLNSPVPLTLVPCVPVASHLSITVAELEKHLAPFSRLGQYLTDIVRGYGDNQPGWSKVIWDLAVSAWAVTPGALKIVEESAPALCDDLTWRRDPGGRTIKVTRLIDRDAVMADFYTKANGSGA
jgi:inosine-uridine nucleoside N-ribohydrolase